MSVATGVPKRAAVGLVESGASCRARLSREGAFQVDIGERELVVPGKARGHGELDPPHAAAHQGADLQELQADGAAGGVGKPGVAERDPAQLVEQHVGHRREPKAELVGRHGRRRAAVGEQVELLLLDPVFHFAARTIEILVKGAGVDPGSGQGGDHEAKIGTAGQMLGLAHDPPRPAPGLLCPVSEILEHPGRLAGRLAPPVPPINSVRHRNPGLSG